MPNIRRFVLDHNIRMAQPDQRSRSSDYAKAYGVTAIPSNVLIGRDGTVIHLDLSRKNLDSVITRSRWALRPAGGASRPTPN